MLKLHWSINCSQLACLMQQAGKRMSQPYQSSFDLFRVPLKIRFFGGKTVFPKQENQKSQQCSNHRFRCRCVSRICCLQDCSRQIHVHAMRLCAPLMQVVSNYDQPMAVTIKIKRNKASSSNFTLLMISVSPGASLFRSRIACWLGACVNITV